MEIYFKSLFKVEVKHSYFKSGFTDEISIVPTKETSELTGGRKLLYKKSDFGFQIFYKAFDSAGTPFVSFTNAKFTYALLLKGPSSFENYTQLDVGPTTYKAGNILYFTNDPPAAENISHQILEAIKPGLFTYQFPFQAATPATDTASLEILDSIGASVQVISTALKPNGEGTYSVSIDFRSKPKGKYTLRISDNTHPFENHNIYIDSDLASKPLLGVLDINYTPGMRNTYFLNFLRKNTRWKYYIVNKSNKIDLTSTTLAIADTSVDV